MDELAILFTPMRTRNWRVFVLQHPDDMAMDGLDEHGAAHEVPDPDFEDLRRRLAECHHPPLYRTRGASNGGVRLSFAACLVPTVREWLDDLLTTSAKRAG
jgi:hypothetical protein